MTLNRVLLRTICNYFFSFALWPCENIKIWTCGSLRLQRNSILKTCRSHSGRIHLTKSLMFVRVAGLRGDLGTWAGYFSYQKSLGFRIALPCSLYKYESEHPCTFYLLPPCPRYPLRFPTKNTTNGPSVSLAKCAALDFLLRPLATKGIRKFCLPGSARCT